MEFNDCFLLHSIILGIKLNRIIITCSLKLPDSLISFSDLSSSKSGVLGGDLGVF